MLYALILAPFIAAILMTATSQRDGKSAGRLALILGLVPLALVAALFHGGESAVSHDWFTMPGTHAVVRFALLADGLSLWLSGLATLLTGVALMAARTALSDRFREFAVGMFVLEGTMLGTFLASDALLFFFFFESMIIPAAVLIAAFGGVKRKAGAMTFALYTLLGSAPMAVALWYGISVSGTTDPASLANRIAGMPERVQDLLFWGFVLAFAVKTPIFPFHGWQARSYSEAPATLSAILSGAMAKAGVFGFAAWVLPLFPQAVERHGDSLLWLSLFSLLYGALMALRQKDAKHLLAFSSMSHLGLAVAGIFSLHQGAYAGVLLLLVAHGLSAGAQFLLCGMAERWTGSRSLADMGGFASTNGVFSFLFGAAGIAAVAVPGTAGFVGEFLILQGLWQSVGPFAALAGGLGMILSACYAMRFLQAFLFGPAQKTNQRLSATLSVSEAIAVFPLVALLLFFGVRPAPVLDSVQDSETPVASIEEAVTPSTNAEVLNHVP